MLAVAKIDPFSPELKLTNRRFYKGKVTFKLMPSPPLRYHGEGIISRVSL